MIHSSYRIPLFAYALLVFGLLYQTRVYFPQLPPMVASHFNLAGEPDGFSSRERFRLFSLLIQGGTAGFFLLLAMLIRFIPASRISIPNSEFWRTGEHREESLAFLGRSILWMGALTFAFMLMIFQATIRANLSEVIILGRSFWISFGFYIGAMALLVWKLLDQFRLPHDASQ